MGNKHLLHLAKRSLLVAACAGSLAGTAPTLTFSTVIASETGLKRASSWNWPDNKNLLTELSRFVQSQISEGKSNSRGQDLSAMESVRGVGLLEGIIQVASTHDPSIDALVKKLQGSVTSESQQEIESSLDAVLSNGRIPERIKADMQLLVSRSFVQNALYDEAMPRLERITLESVSDPATLLFNLAVCQHHLLQKEECLQTLSRLLERETDIPTRYAITARLMEADIKPLQEDTLDEISRLMNDVERRLALGRTGKIVRDKQQAIVDKLEKSIDQMEQQLQQQQQQQQQQQDQSQQSQQDSMQQSDQGRTAEVPGADSDNPNDESKSGDWGNLPPAQRQEALQNMTKELPSHYRDVIEAYFKRLATAPK